MQLAEDGQHGLGSEPERARAARMVPVRRTVHHHQGLDGDAGGSQCRHGIGLGVIGIDGTRSEEHTSELQSLMRISYAVFCLKKKKKNKHEHKIDNKITNTKRT